MSTKQSQAIWELCRQGWQRTADHAAHCWHSGQRFQTNEIDGATIARSLAELIDQCNWEIEKSPAIGVFNEPFNPR